MRTTSISALASVLILFALSGSPVAAQTGQAPSCNATGPIVGYVRKGDVTVLLSCPDPVGSNPFPCTCHEPVPGQSTCRVYACDGKAQEATGGEGMAATDSNDPKAQFDLAMKLMRGDDGGVQQPDEALRLFSSSADKGYAPAQFMMGVETLWGPVRKLENLSADAAERRAFEWFSKAAAQGDPDGAAWLGQLYASGDAGGFMPKNAPEAYFWLKLAVKEAAALPQRPGHAAFGNPYMTRGDMIEAMQQAEKPLTPEDIAAADKRLAAWKPGQPPVLEPVARGGVPIVQPAPATPMPAPAPPPPPPLTQEEHLAQQRDVWEADQSNGRERRLARLRAQVDTAAIDEIRKRAKAGDAKAQFDLGWLYARGMDDQLPNDPNMSDAEKNAGFARMSPRPPDNVRLDRDYKQALKWYKRAATQGNAEAQLDLGMMYEFGTGTPRNREEAYFWYSLSRRAGIPGGEMFLQDPGLKSDKIKALNKRLESWRSKPEHEE